MEKNYSFAKWSDFTIVVFKLFTYNFQHVS